MSKHCDGVVDCDENLDKINCDLLKIDLKLYRKEHPPLQKGAIFIMNSNF